MCRDGDRDWGNVTAKNAKDCQELPEARMRQGKILPYGFRGIMALSTLI